MFRCDSVRRIAQVASNRLSLLGYYVNTALTSGREVGSSAQSVCEFNPIRLSTEFAQYRNTQAD